MDSPYFISFPSLALEAVALQTPLALLLEALGSS